MNNYFKYIFLILTYRNGEDIYDLNSSIKDKFEDYHILIVNSFYDNETEKRIQEIANDVGGTFFSVENKGYGAGNNAGIKYALDHFSFDYIIVANSDLIVQHFNPSRLPRSNSIIGPQLTTITGKAQNPYWEKKRAYIEKLLYLGHKKQSRYYMILGQGLNRVYREMFLSSAKRNEKPRRVYAVHGACVMFTFDVAKRLYPVYDDNMFLYYEEAYLARRAQALNIDVYYYPMFSVLHKEDGSTKGLNVDLSRHATDSYLYYYTGKKYDN